MAESDAEDEVAMNGDKSFDLSISDSDSSTHNTAGSLEIDKNSDSSTSSSSGDSSSSSSVSDSDDEESAQHEEYLQKYLQKPKNNDISDDSSEDSSADFFNDEGDLFEKSAEIPRFKECIDDDDGNFGVSKEDSSKMSWNNKCSSNSQPGECFNHMRLDHSQSCGESSNYSKLDGEFSDYLDLGGESFNHSELGGEATNYLQFGEPTNNLCSNEESSGYLPDDGENTPGYLESPGCEEEFSQHLQPAGKFSDTLRQLHDQSMDHSQLSGDLWDDLEMQQQLGDHIPGSFDFPSKEESPDDANLNSVGNMMETSIGNSRDEEKIEPCVDQRSPEGSNKLAPLIAKDTDGVEDLDNHEGKMDQVEILENSLLTEAMAESTDDSSDEDKMEIDVKDENNTKEDLLESNGDEEMKPDSTEHAGISRAIGNAMEGSSEATSFDTDVSEVMEFDGVLEAEQKICRVGANDHEALEAGKGDLKELTAAAGDPEELKAGEGDPMELKAALGNTDKLKTGEGDPMEFATAGVPKKLEAAKDDSEMLKFSAVDLEVAPGAAIDETRSQNSDVCEMKPPEALPMRAAAKPKFWGKGNGDEKSAAQYIRLRPGMKFRCNKCGWKNFNSMAKCQQHMKVCRGQSASSCKQGTAFTTTLGANRMDVHLTRKVFMCSACQSYYQSWNLYQHMHTVHNKQICLACLSMFGSAMELQKHLNVMHGVKTGRFPSFEKFKNVFKGFFYATCTKCGVMFDRADENHVCPGKTVQVKQKQNQMRVEARVCNPVNFCAVAMKEDKGKCLEMGKGTDVVVEGSEMAGKSLEVIGKELEVSGKCLDVSVGKGLMEAIGNVASEVKPKPPLVPEHPKGTAPLPKRKRRLSAKARIPSPPPVKRRKLIIKLNKSTTAKGNKNWKANRTIDSSEEEDITGTYIPYVDPDEPLKSPKSPIFKGNSLSMVKTEPNLDQHQQQQKSPSNTLSPVEMVEEQQKPPTSPVALIQPVPKKLEPLLGLHLESTEDAKLILKECAKTSSSSCLFCHTVGTVAINGQALLTHILRLHRYTPTKDEFSWDSIVEKFEANKPRLQAIHFNTTSYDSEDGPSQFIPFGRNTFACMQCHYASALLKDVCSHKRRVHQKNSFLCCMCQSIFNSYSELLCHLCPGKPCLDAPQYVNMEFRCCFCVEVPTSGTGSVVYPSAFRLMVHLRKRHDTCDLCLTLTNSQAELYAHMPKHKVHHVCYKCGLAYRNKQDINNHLFWKHGAESVVCKRCLQKKWPHVYHFCQQAASYPCEDCGAEFKKAVALTVHKRLHAGVTPYTCDKCGQKFISKKVLGKHDVFIHQPPPQQVQPVAATEDKEDEKSKKRGKKGKESKRKNKKPLLEDLPPLNLSSDSEEEVLSKGADYNEAIVAATMGEGSAKLAVDDVVRDVVVDSTGDEDCKDANVDNGNIANGDAEGEPADPSIWNNLTIIRDLDRENALKKEERERSSFYEAWLRMEHSYCKVRDEDERRDEEEEEPSKGEECPKDTPTKQNQKRQSPSNSDSKCHDNSDKRRGSSSSSSGSSSDSDSSGSTCGSNCSCGRSRSSYSSSSESSARADSPPLEEKMAAAVAAVAASKKKDKKKKKKKKKKRKSKKSVKEEKEEVVEEKTLPIEESDLDTDLSATDEEFYDERPHLQHKLNSIAQSRALSMTQQVPQQHLQPAQRRLPSPSMQKPLIIRRKSDFQGQKRPKMLLPVKPHPGKPRPNSNGPKKGFAGSAYAATFSAPQPPQPVHIGEANGWISKGGSGNSGGGGQKRQRVRNKFYGYTTSDEEEAAKGGKEMAGRGVGGQKKVRKPSSPRRPKMKFIPPTHYKPAPQYRKPQYLQPQGWQRLTMRMPRPSCEGAASDSDSSASLVIDTSVANVAKAGASVDTMRPKPAERTESNLYCYCRCPYDEVSEMIACDGDNCAIEWFHFECVGVMVPPEGKWYCPACRKGRGE